MKKRVITGRVLALARPERNETVQRIAYNGEKRRHAIEFQAVDTHSVLEIYLAGPTDGRVDTNLLFP